MASSADFACPTSSAADAASGVGGVVERPGQRGARGLRGLPQRVQLGQPADVVDECVVLTGLRVDSIDLAESELQPVGLLRQFPCPLRFGRPGRGARPATTSRICGSASAAAPTSAKRSSAARCSSPRISRSWSFCPCRVSSSVVKLLSDFAGTLRPPRYARDGPSRLTDRAAMTLPSSSRSAPRRRESRRSRSHVVAELAVLNRPSTTARSAPDQSGWRRRAHRQAGDHPEGRASGIVKDHAIVFRATTTT